MLCWWVETGKGVACLCSNRLSGSIDLLHTGDSLAILVGSGCGFHGQYEVIAVFGPRSSGKLWACSCTSAQRRSEWGGWASEKGSRRGVTAEARAEGWVKGVKGGEMREVVYIYDWNTCALIHEYVCNPGHHVFRACISCLPLCSKNLRRVLLPK